MSLFAAENRTYFLLLGTTLFLVVFGLVMVLSASFVVEISADASPFGVFLRQSLYAIIGIPLMLVASRMPPRFWKRWAWPALLIGGALQLLVFVPGIGWGYGGNQNWISIAGFNAQPSEFVKVALIVWIAWVLSTKQELLGDWKHVALPIAPIAGIAILFVLIGNDLGTAMIMVLIVLGTLFFAGVKLRFLAISVVGIALLGVAFAMASSSRSSRISTWLNGCGEQDYSGSCWQVLHGTWALANGGLTGVGLGNSKASWNWLPHAESDFIFAIIGEELGLVGAVVVLALFVVLAIAFVRVIRGTKDSFARIVTAGVMVWVIGQAFVNIAVVLGVLPVLGVPLPLISAGGSALLANLLGIGIVLSFARHREPDRDPSFVEPAFGSRLIPDGLPKRRG
ncbi:cell division protein FtsW [Microbacteriaceae bacterium SG_E_30_P1]|uniref:Probable peptidoglycan glycosyltransferase FtsW n=1 Tax=Antiquaquibacter oligotrophicus TaxID=2880260 RepID=A0ABT6KNS4_9MICO|nr:putative lipid II flippase FtsW [Antiquaquibacter oligotrophicus]MDH6180819.1 cell division protein FtsW [Antiquaquibacter oligotrophicus]UDF14742.1 putative lipid II flippase FtsW [Antiquaquibacter oligotrophicus]